MSIIIRIKLYYIEKNMSFPSLFEYSITLPESTRKWSHGPDRTLLNSRSTSIVRNGKQNVMAY